MVGLRYGTNVHVPAFRADSRSVVVALAGRDAERTQTAASALGIPRAYGDWRDLFADDAVDEIDAVSIAVPPSEQPAIIRAAALLGKHVFCEKPLAATVAEAESALEGVRRAGVVHAIDFIFPEIEVWQRARTLLREGAIGKPRHFSYRWQVGNVARTARIDSWKTRSDDGGGVVGNLLSHVLFNLEWLLGDVVGIDCVPRREARTTALFCDCVAYLEDGINGSISMSTVAYLGCGHAIEIFGESGTMVLRNQTPGHHADGFELSLGTGETRRLDVVVQDPLRSDVDGRITPVGCIIGRFLDAICHGGTVRPNLEDGVRVQRWLQQVTDAAGR